MQSGHVMQSEDFGEDIEISFSFEYLDFVFLPTCLDDDLDLWYCGGLRSM